MSIDGAINTFPGTASSIVHRATVVQSMKNVMMVAIIDAFGEDATGVCQENSIP
jgi:hypothetical protein